MEDLVVGQKPGESMVRETHHTQATPTPFAGAFAGRRVLVTGHTGFKGAWLCEWLLRLGADLTGFALEPPTQPALFDQLSLASRMRSIRGDVRDADVVRRVIVEVQPDFLFHLAAQPLVRLSYETPVETYATNVMGTVHVLDSLRALNHPCAAVLVTTDKCYENKEWVHSYREEDPMGGYDPYSSSKGAAELVIAAYRRSFFSQPGSRIRIASARAGNVVGGGDWAADRIVPDCIRALAGRQPIAVRNKHATRPWQHVLEPLSGYLWLAACLANPQLAPGAAAVQQMQPGAAVSRLASAFNFGPPLASNRTVADLVAELLRHWPGTWLDRTEPNAVHEAALLNLATDKSHHVLGWRPVWGFEETIRETVGWYQAMEAKTANPVEFTQEQIARFVAAAGARHLVWAAR